MVSIDIKAVLGILLAAADLCVFVSPIPAQTAGEVLKGYETLKNPERKSRLIEGARKEGNLVFYGTLGVDASRPLLEKFRQAHPIFRSAIIARAQPAFTTGWSTKREPANTKSIL
jgi:hypothetical protein